MKTILSFAVIGLLVFGGWYWFGQKNETSYTPSIATSTTSVVATAPASDTAVVSTSTAPSLDAAKSKSKPIAKTYTLADVSAHASGSDCWTAVNGKVYDVTSFIPSHPGGDEILKVCGKDGTRLFSNERQHAANNAQATLDTYYVGNLATK